MTKILRAACFLAVFLAGNEGMCFAYHELRAAASPSFANDFTRGSYPDDYSTLFLGDSVFLTGIDTGRIPNAYNLSFLGASYRENYFALDWVLRSKPDSLRTVVIQLDRHSFSAARMDNFWFIHKVSPWRVLQADCRDRQRGRYVREWVDARLLPYAGIVQQYGEWTNDDAPPHRAGFVPMPNLAGPRQALTAANAERIARGLIGESGWYDARMRWYLDAMVSRARAHGLEVVLVETPVSEIFDRTLHAHAPEDEFDRKLQSIQEDHPDSKRLNYRDEYQGQDGIFANPNHLSMAGARKWTSRIQSDLAALGVAD